MRTIRGALLAIALGFVLAQAAPAQQPAPRMVETARDLAGTVKKVDPGSRRVQVSSGILGLFRTTVAVADDTRIQVEGREASLADISEGAPVKVSYEVRDGVSVATSIEVAPSTRTTVL